MSLKKVTNCYDCPFQNNDNEQGYSCNYPMNDVYPEDMTPYEKQNEPNIPEKCPLRNGDILITIK